MPGNKRITIPQLTARKGGIPIVCLSTYTAPFAKILDQVTDILLVGDSLGMIIYGMESTLGVTLEMMIAHGRAVSNASHKACVVVDMPFGSYQASPEQAFTNAARLFTETQCSAVKLEGGEEMAETVAFLTKRAIPVMGHIGLMPQHIHMLGGYRYQGRDEHDRKRLMESAKAIEKSGAFAIVLEGVEETLAKDITEALSIPTIGIGASPACDGQVLVADDMVGLFTDYTPKFVKKYADFAGELERAATAFASEVRARTFPTAEHCFRKK